MKIKISDKSLFVSGIVGLLTGLVSAHSLFAHSATAIYFWGVIGLILGLFAPYPKVQKIGLVYGFTMMLSFLLFGFQGKSDKLLNFTALAVGLSVVSALCGWLSVFLGAKIKLLFRSKK